VTGTGVERRGGETEGATEEFGRSQQWGPSPHSGVWRELSDKSIWISILSRFYLTWSLGWFLLENVELQLVFI